MLNKTKKRVDFSKRFEKQLHKAPAHIRRAVRKRIAVFLSNPRDLRLRSHSLKGNYQGLWSINITGDWRALYRPDITREMEIFKFELLGTHSQLYKK